jgi:hypothetical protein
MTPEAQGFMLAVLMFSVLAVWGCAHGGRAILRAVLKVKTLSNRAQAASYAIGGAMGSVAIAWAYGDGPDGPEQFSWFLAIAACAPIALMGVLVSLETWKLARSPDETRPVP